MPTWSILGASSWATGNNLVQSGIALNSGQSATADDTFMTKSILTTKYDVKTNPLAGYGTNDWVIKADIQPNVTFTSFSLNYHATNDATACAGTGTAVTVYCPCATITNGYTCIFYDDAAGTSIASNGFYSNGTDLFVQAHFSMFVDTCGGSSTGANFIVGNDTNLCFTGSTATLYWSGTYGTSTTLYFDSALTTLATSFDYIVGPDGLLRTIGYSDAVVGSDTGLACSVGCC